MRTNTKKSVEVPMPKLLPVGEKAREEPVNSEASEEVPFFLFFFRKRTRPKQYLWMNWYSSPRSQMILHCWANLGIYPTIRIRQMRKIRKGKWRRRNPNCCRLAQLPGVPGWQTDRMTHWINSCRRKEWNCLLRKEGFSDLIAYFEGWTRMQNNNFLCYRHEFPGESKGSPMPNC